MPATSGSVDPSEHGDRTQPKRWSTPTLWQWVSYVSAPQLSATYFFLVLALPGSVISIWLASSVIFATLVPLLILGLMVRLMKVDADVSRRTDRWPIYGLSVVSYAVGALVLFVTGAPSGMFVLMVAYTVNTILALVVTLCYEKVSAHVWGVFGPAIVILFFVGASAYTVAALGGAVTAVSRAKLGRHTAFQIGLTVVLASATTVAVVLAFRNFV